MSIETNIIHLWYNKVWVDRDFEIAAEIYRPAPAQDWLNPEAHLPLKEVLELVDVMKELVENQLVKVLKTVEQGPWLSALVEMKGFKAGTEQPVSMRWMTMIRVDDGAIVESYPQVNMLKLFEQLDQLPPDCFELLLSGTVLR